MRLEILPDGSRVEFEIRLDPDETVVAEGQQGMGIELITDRFSVGLPSAQATPHADLLALAALTVLRPWCRNRLIVSTGVSAAFANAASVLLDVDVGPVIADLAPRSVGDRLGLMYSGGPDCMAAELLLGKQLPLFHFLRVKHPRVPNRMLHVKSALQADLVRRAVGRGYEVYTAQSDLEYLCRPFATFPHWSALTIGAVLQADDIGLGGLVTGRTLSGIWLAWGTGFQPGGENEEAWNGMFLAAGVPLVQPLAGASDVVSKRLAREHRLHDLARSCLVGTQAGPCRACHKCMTNELIYAALKGVPLPAAAEGGVDPTPALRARMNGGPPFRQLHVLEYAFARIPDLEQTWLASAAEVVQGDSASTEWVEAYYRPALAAVPGSLVDSVSDAVERHIGFMDPDQERFVEQWNTDCQNELEPR